MNRAALALVCIACGFSALSCAAGAAAPIPTWQPSKRTIVAKEADEVVPPSSVGEDRVEVFLLENGLQVILKRRQLSKVLALQLWVEAGSAADPVDLPGVAHAWEHLLLPAQNVRAVEASGGQVDAWTTQDQTVFQVIVGRGQGGEALELLAGGLRRGAQEIPKVELTETLRALSLEIREAEAEPARLATMALLGAAYTVHPYRRPVLGRAATMERLAKEQLGEFFSQHYRAHRMTLVAVGDLVAGEFRKEVTKAFGGLRGGKRASLSLSKSSEKGEAPQTELKVVATAGGGDRTHLALGFHIPSAQKAEPKEIATLDLLRVVLGVGDGSRLHLELSQNREVARELSAQLYTPLDPGMLILSAEIDPAKLAEGAQALVAECLRLGQRPVGGAELARARQVLLADHAYQSERASGVARRLGYFATTFGDVKKDAVYRQALREAAPEDLRVVAQRYLRLSNLTIAAAMPRPRVPLRAESGAARRARVLREALAPQGITEAERLLKTAATQAEVALQNPPTPPARSGETTVAAPNFSTHRLRNGARVLVVEDREAPVVALRALWSGGQRVEDERTHGLSALLSAALPKGTKTRSAEQIRREVDSIGGVLQGFSGPGSFGLKLEMLSNHLDRGLALFVDCLRNPALPDEELERERRKQLLGLKSLEKNLGHGVLRLFLRTLFPRHVLNKEPLGSAQTVEGLPRRRLLDTYQKYYPLSTMTLVAVGDVDSTSLLERLEAMMPPQKEEAVRVAFPALSPALAPAPKKEAPKVPGIQSVLEHGDKEEAHLIVGYEGIPLRDGDRYALEVALEILAGPGGRLERILRERRLSEKVAPIQGELADLGYFGVYARTTPSQADALRGLLQQEIKGLLVNKPTQEELSTTRQVLAARVERDLERRGMIASWMATYSLAELPPTKVFEHPDSLRAVRLADLERVLLRLVDDKKGVLAAIVPERLTPAQQKLRERPSPPPPPPKTAAKKGVARKR